MKKFYAIVLFTLIAAQASALITGDGFYRVNNYKTQRYIYVTDNTGSINVQATTAEMGAIQLWTDHSRTIADPASIIYIKKVGDAYDLIAQGTGVHALVGYYVVLDEADGLYQLYAEGKYLCDNETSDSPDGLLGTERKGDYRKWEVTPVESSTDNFFGLKPTLKVGASYWQPFYADFAVSLADGMKAYYISEVHDEAVIFAEITDEIIADNTPMYIECASAEAASNKLELYYRKGTSYTDNCLSGVYFNNDDRPKSADARTKYDPATMRVLGRMKNGKLGFVMKNLDYLPANQSYLVVPETAYEELPIMTAEEYEVYAQELHVKSANASVKRPVYSILGVKIADDADAIDNLPAGLYIIGNRKVVVR